MENRKYNLKELTPESMWCVAAACPSIYEVEERTPESLKCTPLPVCPGIYEVPKNGRYAIIGKIEKPEEFGLEEKVGKGEILVSVPKGLIDEMGRE